jgi:hypothetical protein
MRKRYQLFGRTVVAVLAATAMFSSMASAVAAEEDRLPQRVYTTGESGSVLPGPVPGPVRPLQKPARTDGWVGRALIVNDFSPDGY